MSLQTISEQPDADLLYTLPKPRTQGLRDQLLFDLGVTPAVILFREVLYTKVFMIPILPRGIEDKVMWTKAASLGSKMAIMRSSILSSDCVARSESSVANIIMKLANPELFGTESISQDLRSNFGQNYNFDFAVENSRFTHPSNCYLDFQPQTESLKSAGGASLLKSLLVHLDKCIVKSNQSLRKKQMIHLGRGKSVDGGYAYPAGFYVKHDVYRMPLHRVKSILGSVLSKIKSFDGGSTIHVLFVRTLEDTFSDELQNVFSNHEGYSVTLSPTLDEDDRYSTFNRIAEMYVGIIQNAVKTMDSVHAIYFDSLHAQAITEAFRRIDPCWWFKIPIMILNYDRQLIEQIGNLPSVEYMTDTFQQYRICDAENGECSSKASNLSSIFNSNRKRIFVLENHAWERTNWPYLGVNQGKEPVRTFRTAVHFIYSSSLTSKFTMGNFIAISSAMDKIKPERVIFHYKTLPSGYWWEKAKFLVHPQQLDTELPYACSRLEVLLKFGGISLNLDAWVLKDIDGIQFNTFEVIVASGGSTEAINFPMIAAVANSTVLRSCFALCQKHRANLNDRPDLGFLVAELKHLQSYPEKVYFLPNYKVFSPGDAFEMAKFYIQTKCSWLDRALLVNLRMSEVLATFEEMSTSSLWEFESCFFRLARNLLRSVENQESLSVFGVEMNEIVIGIPLDSMEALEILSRTWVAYARHLGCQVILFTSTPALYAKWRNASNNKFNVRPKLIFLSSNTSNIVRHQLAANHSHEWKPFEMMKYLIHNNPTAKWFMKVDADTMVRPELLRAELAGFDPLQPYYIGSRGKYFGNLHFRSSNTSKYVRLTYAQGHCYGVSLGATRLLNSHLDDCMSWGLHEDKGMALCIRENVGIGLTSLPYSYSPITHLSPRDRNIAVYHHMKPEDIIKATQMFYGHGTMATPKIDVGGYLQQDINERGNSRSAHLGNPRTNFHFRGAFIPLLQDMCFASTKRCGWVGITRSECLQIGCCFKEGFIDPCFPPSGDFETELKTINEKKPLQDSILKQKRCTILPIAHSNWTRKSLNIKPPSKGEQHQILTPNNYAGRRRSLSPTACPSTLSRTSRARQKVSKPVVITRRNPCGLTTPKRIHRVCTRERKPSVLLVLQNIYELTVDPMKTLFRSALFDSVNKRQVRCPEVADCVQLEMQIRSEEGCHEYHLFIDSEARCKEKLRNSSCHAHTHEDLLVIIRGTFGLPAAGAIWNKTLDVEKSDFLWLITQRSTAKGCRYFDGFFPEILCVLPGPLDSLCLPQWGNEEVVSKIDEGEYLHSNIVLQALNLKSFLTLQADGNLCAYKGDPIHNEGLLGCSGTGLDPSSTCTSYFILKAGEFRMYQQCGLSEPTQGNGWGLPDCQIKGMMMINETTLKFACKIQSEIQIQKKSVFYPLSTFLDSLSMLARKTSQTYTGNVIQHIRPGERLQFGSILQARHRDAFLTLQSDGNLCAYKGEDPAHNGGGLGCSRIDFLDASSSGCEIVFDLECGVLNIYKRCGSDPVVLLGEKGWTIPNCSIDRIVLLNETTLEFSCSEGPRSVFKTLSFFLESTSWLVMGKSMDPSSVAPIVETLQHLIRHSWQSVDSKIHHLWSPASKPRTT
eukprot:CAMPEP_0114495244 /NCGR_PEP_ID=MMETSP0109-20121206/5101_1 /TAXON_ID=29199 /ORGANISM="Chlorarachnion reptans, Strain CCCM449" /LENGTH=1602 /DNA_ID=CAMNT_0001672373 /DNA_START=819 /DNA_END=5627 /DNA_ORIENTATION=+